MPRCGRRLWGEPWGVDTPLRRAEEMMKVPYTGSERSQLIGQFSAETLTGLDRMDERELAILEADPEVSLQANASRLATILQSRSSTFEVFQDIVFHSRLGCESPFTDAQLAHFLLEIWNEAPTSDDSLISPVTSGNVDVANVGLMMEHLLQAPGPREAKLLVAILLKLAGEAGSLDGEVDVDGLALFAAEDIDDVERGLDLAHEAEMINISWKPRGQRPTIEIVGWFWKCMAETREPKVREGLILPDDIWWSERLPEVSRELYRGLLQHYGAHRFGNSEPVYMIALHSDVGGSEVTHAFLQPLVALGLVELDEDEEIDDSDVSGHCYRLVEHPDRFFAADLLELYREDSERDELEQLRLRSINSDWHIRAGSIARELVEVRFLEDRGDKLANGTARLTRARESVEDEVRRWRKSGYGEVDWNAATEWMIQRIASNITEESLAYSRKVINEIRRSKDHKQDTTQMLEDGLVFEEWLLSKYPEAHKVKDRFWRADRFEPQPMPDFRVGRSLY